MKQEHSAGGVILKLNTKPQILLIQDSNRNWTFPKGLIEPTESPKDAAVREVQEETGLRALTYRAQLGTIRYEFSRDGQPTQKSVDYFLFTVTGNPPVIPQAEEGINKAEWVDLHLVHQTLGYKESQSVFWRETLKSINTIMQKV